MSLRVLIVDDEENLRVSLAAYLDDEGMQPVAVGSGEEALEAARSGDLCVCVMDIRLPGMSGDDAMRALLRAHPGLKFIVYTGSSNYELPEDLVEAGIAPEAVFHKPLRDMALLAEAIRCAAQGEGGA